MEKSGSGSTEGECEIAQYHTCGEGSKGGGGQSPYTPELRRWDLQKDNHGGMAQENPPVWKIHYKHTCTITQGKTEKKDEKGLCL